MSKFTIYPAIDILGAKCVRLFKGDYEQSTVYDDSPVSVAKRWKEAGAEFLHLVDLDGAKIGQPINSEIIHEIKKTVDIPVQIGGGIRGLETAKNYLSSGIDRIILGTAALEDKEFTKSMLGEYGDRIAVGMDCRDGKIAIEGWLEDSDVTAIELAKELKKHGLNIVIYTDIAKDGTLEGPNLEALKEFSSATGVQTIASGGVSSEKDIFEIKALKDSGLSIDGAIIGKALYSGNIELKDLLSKI